MKKSDTMVLGSNVKCAGKILPRGMVINPEDPRIDLLKPYLVSEDGLVNKQKKTIRISDSVPAEDPIDDVSAVNKIKGKTTPAPEAGAADEENKIMTNAEIKAALDAKGIDYAPNANKADLLALLNAE